MKVNNKYVCLWGRPHIYTCCAILHERRIFYQTNQLAPGPRAICPIWASVGAKFSKMWDSLPRRR